MNVSLNLKTPSEKTSPVRVLISHNGKKYRKALGMTVRTSTWRKSSQKCSDDGINSRLMSVRLYLMETLDDTSSEDCILAALENASRIARGLPVQEPDVKYAGSCDRRPAFWDYFREWSERDSTAIRQRRNHYKTLLSIIGEKCDWEDVDSALYLRLVREMDRREYSKNYQGTLISKLKVVMSEGLKLKYHASTEYQSFRKTSEQPDTIYLTEEELERLWNVELSSHMQRACRDLFLIGVYTAARFSDYSRLGMDDVHGGMIRFFQQKTGQSVMMPLSPKVRTLLERNGGHAPAVGQVVFNREIKSVCMAAGITDKVTVTRSRGARRETSVVPKYRLVSSHTARRTGATLLYMSGVPIRQCMMITGHQSEACFMKYIRITKEENARLLVDNPFFR